MPAGLAADTGNVAPLRRLRPVLLCACLACACLPSSAALGAQATASNVHYKHRAHGPRGHHYRCARRASFHTGQLNRRRGRHRSGCGHHRAAHHRPGRGLHRQAAHLPAHHSSSCVGADLVPTDQNLAIVRAATLCLINRERAGSGESPLSVEGRLEQIAQDHSQDMASADYFDHVGPRGDSPVSRMRAAGYLSRSVGGYEVGENIAWGTLWLATPRSIVAGWMNSPGHRANILDGHFRDTGIGISPHPLASLARGQAGAMYTQDFGVTISG
jgi:uncharacterized protein YkwD